MDISLKRTQTAEEECDTCLVTHGSMSFALRASFLILEKHLVVSQVYTNFDATKKRRTRVIKRTLLYTKSILFLFLS